MGLDVSHECWSGPYSAFHRWRCWLAEQAGYPPLDLMEGFQIDESDRKAYVNAKYPDIGSPMPIPPIRQFPFHSDPLSWLLFHSDCDGKIHWSLCKGIALRLAGILHRWKNAGGNGFTARSEPGHPYYRRRLQEHLGREHEMPARADYDGPVMATRRFALGLLRAHRDREHVRFH